MVRGFSAGSVLGRSFEVWFRNLIPFTVLSLIVLSPLVLYTIILISGDLTDSSFGTWTVLTYLLSALLGLITTGAVTYGVFEQLRGGNPGIGSCIRVGVGRVFPILGVAIAQVLCIILGALAMLIPGAILGALVLSIAGVIVAALAMFISAAILLCMFWVAVPVAVVERPGIFASLGRSRALTRGSRWSILAILIVLGALNYLCGLVLGGAVLGPTEAATGVPENAKVYMALELPVNVLLGALQAVVSSVAYHDLRVAKEGVGIEELAKVFE